MSYLKYLFAAYVLVAPGATQSARFVVANASVAQFAQAMLSWGTEHRSSKDELIALKVDVPNLDFYTPDGNSIWYGADPNRNAAFLDSLPRTVRGAQQSTVRPTLAETLAMFPELKSRENELLHAGVPVVVAITYADWDRCKPQNDAVQRLARRSSAHDLEVVEIHLHR